MALPYKNALRDIYRQRKKSIAAQVRGTIYSIMVCSYAVVMCFAILCHFHLIDFCKAFMQAPECSFTVAIEMVHAFMIYFSKWRKGDS